MKTVEIRDRKIFRKKVAGLRDDLEKQRAKPRNISVEELQRMSLRLKTFTRVQRKMRKPEQIACVFVVGYTAEKSLRIARKFTSPKVVHSCVVIVDRFCCG